MRGYSSTSICGNVGDPIRFGRTEATGEDACSFSVAIEKRREAYPVWVKVNAYGGNAKMCKEKLVRGGYVFVSGELMNRTIGGEQALEVRANEIIFMPQKPVTGTQDGD